MNNIPDEDDLDRLVGSASVPARVTEPDQFFLAKLAQEIAMNIRPVEEILDTYKITPDRYKELEKIPFFKAALDAYVIEWNSAKTTNERLRIEAAAGLEAAMPALIARMQSQNEDLGKAVEAAKLLSKISGAEASQKDGGAPGDKFSITINLGEDVKLNFEKDVKPVEPQKPMITVVPEK